MDAIFFVMDYFRNFVDPSPAQCTIHTAAYRRLYPHCFPVDSIGYVPEKRSLVDHVMYSYNFSFILSGSGYYRVGDTTVRIEGPCVITQWPGEPMYYGPDDTWEELYLIYHSRCGEALTRRGFYLPERRWWNMHGAPRLTSLCQELMRMLDSIADPCAADTVDTICEAMILESLSSARHVRLSREERIVRELEENMRKNFLQEFDIAACARDNGIHPATLRRYWARVHEEPPGRFLSDIRLNEACRMLVETRETIAEIAYTLRFEDPLYFSRLFKKRFGTTASEYRRVHQVPMAGR